MKIVWIGAGNLATQLGEALHRAGHETLQVFSRTMASAEALAGRLGCLATDDLDAVVPGADVYIFSVKDGVLEGLVSRIAPRTGDALCLHTAGSMPMDVFRGHAHRYGVLYPMQTFSKDCPVDFKEIPVFVEASTPDVLAQTEQLARSVSDRVEETPPSPSGSGICLQFCEPLLCFGCGCIGQGRHTVRCDVAFDRRDGTEGPSPSARGGTDGTGRALRPERDGSPVRHAGRRTGAESTL